MFLIGNIFRLTVALLDCCNQMLIGIKNSTQLSQFLRYLTFCYITDNFFMVRVTKVHIYGFNCHATTRNPLYFVFLLRPIKMTGNNHTSDTTDYIITKIKIEYYNNIWFKTANTRTNRWALHF
jgi:hypothetical protein